MENQELNLTEEREKLLAFLFRRRKLVIGFTLAVSIAAYGLSFLITPLFLSTAIAQFIYCVQKFKIPKKPTGVIKFIVLSACLYYISSFFCNSIYLMIIQIITGTGLIFILSLIDLKAIKKLILTSK